ncbi:hypothetical protein VNI00_016133 [Paramarasmius palmivorus]|uniref:Uncharacterized protein n=1 Tax=Paramarasmius palmivorus TaxID=297713 RepID=A0AAW0BEV0_9AGAR
MLQDSLPFPTSDLDRRKALITAFEMLLYIAIRTRCTVLIHTLALLVIFAIFHPMTFLRRAKVFLYVCYLLGEHGYIYILRELRYPPPAAKGAGCVYFFSIDNAGEEGDATTEICPTPDSTRMGDWMRYYEVEREDSEREDSEREDSEREDSELEDSEPERDEDTIKSGSSTGPFVRVGDWRRYYSGLTLQRPGNAFVTIGKRTGI